MLALDEGTILVNILLVLRLILRGRLGLSRLGGALDLVLGLDKASFIRQSRNCNVTKTKIRGSSDLGIIPSSFKLSRRWRHASTFDLKNVIKMALGTSMETWPLEPEVAALSLDKSWRFQPIIFRHLASILDLRAKLLRGISVTHITLTELNGQAIA